MIVSVCCVVAIIIQFHKVGFILLLNTSALALHSYKYKPATTNVMFLWDSFAGILYFENIWFFWNTWKISTFEKSFLPEQNMYLHLFWYESYTMVMCNYEKGPDKGCTYLKQKMTLLLHPFTICFLHLVFSGKTALYNFLPEFVIFWNMSRILKLQGILYCHRFCNVFSQYKYL